MASASVLLSEEQFLCSICLDVFTDPVSTPCGHNFCKTCITHYWDSNDVCRCPLCQTIFCTRPDILVNTFISGMADQFRKSKQLKKTSSRDQDPAEPDEVSCDVCTETKLKAFKSCLVCLTSYCETHLEPHQRVTPLRRHKLIDPVKNLEDFICKEHDKPLELFCKTDNVCICQFCTKSDHKLHEIVSLEEAYEGKKEELGKTEAEVQRMIQERQEKIQEVTHSAELSKKYAERANAYSVQVFTTLISCIQRRQAELIHEIEKKQKTNEIQAEGITKDLQQEITELKKRSSELKQLSYTEDHLHFLQNIPSITTPPTTPVNVHQCSFVKIVRTSLHILSQEMEKTLCDAELRMNQQYAVDVTLDPDTAHCELIISKDGKRVSHGDWKNFPDKKERFSEFTRVLGKQGFSSGRFYYEVQVKGKTKWSVGVARASINRKLLNGQSPDQGYWSLGMKWANAYLALAGPDVLLPVKEEVQKVGVFVDYEEGLVSFYDVEARVHLYSFTGCTFTDKLCPILNPGDNEGGKNSAPLIISQTK